MAWTIEVSALAEKQLDRLGAVESRRIRSFLTDRVVQLEDPRQLGKALQGPKLRDYWAYRVGDHRIVCNLLDTRLIVLVLKIGHRRDVYR